MSHFIELHILQNFAPANLNRDDTGAPKDCYFGGTRRARISSQCIKRSVRLHPAFAENVRRRQGDIGIRTKRLLKHLTDALAALDHSRTEAERVGENLLKGAGLKLKDQQKTEYLLYLGANEIAKLADIAHRNWDALVAVAAPEPSAEGDAKQKKDKKKEKSEAKDSIPKEIQREITDVFGLSYAADIALFGRMVADDKNKNVNAACQVAHAISTNQVAMEMDYYTAVDDLLPDEDAGADMIGQVEFNSSCFYRYSNINLDLLRSNLRDDPELVKGAVLGFIEASALAIPTGKQNSMAARNLPSYIRVLVRGGGEPWSLANAFLKPIKTDKKDADVVEISTQRLDEYLGKLKRVYGDDVANDFVVSLSDNDSLSLRQLIAKVENRLSPGGDVQ